MASYKQLRFGGVQMLGNAGVENPDLDTKLLLMHASGKTAAGLILAENENVDDKTETIFHEILGLRAARVPMAYILGYKDFWSLRFRVDENVLIPRPETETVIEHCLEICCQPENILDIGVGSGAILLSLLSEFKQAKGLGVDILSQAIGLAGQNAKKFGLDGRCEFLLSDYLDNVRGRFDLIVSNPPYISKAEMDALAPEIELYEPEIALYGGKNGLDAYKKIIGEAGGIMRNGAALVFEIGHLQKQAVSDLLSSAGFVDIKYRCDLAGKERVISAKKM